MSVLLEAIGLGRTFPSGAGPLQALEGVSLSLSAGERLTITGASGSGKSTLLHILGLLDPDHSGDLLFRGLDVRRLSRTEQARIRLAELGFVFQRSQLLPALNVRENVCLPHWRRHGSRSQALQKADHLLEQLDLGPRRTHDVQRLSGGELQRVGLARALINDPVLLLADEPTASLNAADAARLGELLEAARRRGAALVVVTHDPVLMACEGRVLTLRYGRPEAEEGEG